MQLLVRAVGDPTALKTVMRQEARAADPQLRVTIQTLEEMIDSWLRPLRAVSMMLSVLGAPARDGIGGDLCNPGVRGERTDEGDRDSTALGARHSEIVLMIIRRTSVLIGVGIAIARAEPCC